MTGNDCKVYGHVLFSREDRGSWVSGVITEFGPLRRLSVLRFCSRGLW